MVDILLSAAVTAACPDAAAVAVPLHFTAHSAAHCLLGVVLPPPRRARDAPPSVMHSRSFLRLASPRFLRCSLLWTASRAEVRPSSLLTTMSQPKKVPLSSGLVREISNFILLV